MVRASTTLLLPLAALAHLVVGQAANGASSGASASGQCGAQGGGKQCPEEAPCCSTYGQCGVGAYCLGGCNPKYSFNLQSCMPAPVCQSQDYKMNSLSDISPNTKYLGDASKANWVSSGTPVAYNNQAVLLTMAPSTVGTLLSSTHYVWYGKISATLSTSVGQGVVTAFILMSDVQDEVDFEFVGTDLNNAQSNYYYQGITNYENMKKLAVDDTQKNTHVYEIDWQPDQLTWSIDGNVMRTLKRSDTYNSTAKQYYYPQTPSRIMLSLWPAGLSSNGEGTIEWAGGLVNWDNTKLMQNGYYYAMFEDVTVECYDPPSGTSSKGDSAYEYTSIAGTQGDVAITNDNTILGSFIADGNNQKAGAQAASGTKSAAAAATSEIQSVPGMTGGGAPGAANAPVSNSDSGSSDSSSSSGQSSNVGGSDMTTFSQGGEQSTGGAERVTAGSMVALVAVFAAAMMM